MCIMIDEEDSEDSELFLAEFLSTGTGVLSEILLEKPLVVSVSAKCSDLIICHLKIIL